MNSVQGGPMEQRAFGSSSATWNSPLKAKVIIQFSFKIIISLTQLNNRTAYLLT